MTKKELIDSIRNILSSMDETAKYHPAQIANAIDKAYNQILSTAYKAKRVDLFTKTYYSVSVAKDATTDKYCASLPAPIIQIDGLTDGVINVNTNKGSDLNFFPMTEDAEEMFWGLHAHTVNTKIGYYVKQDKVWFYNWDTAISAVRMTLVIPFSEYDDTDEISLPYGMDSDVVQMAINLLRQTMPRDLRTDNKEIVEQR